MAQIKELIRIAGSDLNGNKNVMAALKNIKGVNTTLANAICNVLSLDKLAKLKEISEEDKKKVEDFLADPTKYNIPAWLLNRRKDPETNEDHHIITTDLVLTKEEDLKSMKKMKSYKGLRHSKGLPVRGQRTKSNFRRNKGKAAKVKRK